MNTNRILVAGIGNIFLGDDAFGVEVVRHLATRSLPPSVRVVDFGIRGIDLTYALLEDHQLVILVDAISRGSQPGTLFVIEPDMENSSTDMLQPHSLAPAEVLASARAMGAKLDQILIVGCEPESFGSDEEPQTGLSPSIAAAVLPAADLVESLIAESLGITARQSESSRLA